MSKRWLIILPLCWKPIFQKALEDEAAHPNLAADPAAKAWRGPASGAHSPFQAIVSTSASHFVSPDQAE